MTGKVVRTKCVSAEWIYEVNGWRHEKLVLVLADSVFMFVCVCYMLAMFRQQFRSVSERF